MNADQSVGFAGEGVTKMKRSRRIARTLLVLVLPVLLFASSSGIGNAHFAGPHTVSFVSTSWKGFTINTVGPAGIATLGADTHVLINCVVVIPSGLDQHTTYMRGTRPVFGSNVTFIMYSRLGGASVRLNLYGTSGPYPCGVANSGYWHTGYAAVAT